MLRKVNLEVHFVLGSKSSCSDIYTDNFLE